MSIAIYIILLMAVSSNCKVSCRYAIQEVDNTTKYDFEINHSQAGNISHYFSSEELNVEDDLCASKPCENGGTCSVNDGIISCQCKKPFIGFRCREMKCGCTNEPCEKDSKGKLICKCPPEYGAYQRPSYQQCKKCDCGIGANCTFVVGTWRNIKLCICKEGYVVSGSKCKAICDPDPCMNGGICNVSDQNVKCMCKDPYTGHRCEIYRCDPNPCLNGGTCSVENKEVICMCKDAYNRCEIYECEPNPCQNGGMCIVNNGKVNCLCKDTYSGDMCEINQCEPNLCQNRGICVLNNGTVNCICKDPYSGKRCEISPCSHNPCENGGTCIITKNTFVCMCKTPYVGIRCETDPCSWNPCQNGGLCRIDNGTAKCFCKDGFTGKNCEIQNKACSWNRCQNGGICRMENSITKCFCTETFTGKYCETQSEPVYYRNLLLIIAVLVTSLVFLIAYPFCKSFWYSKS